MSDGPFFSISAAELELNIVDPFQELLQQQINAYSAQVWTEMVETLKEGGIGALLALCGLSEESAEPVVRTFEVTELEHLYRMDATEEPDR